MTVIVIPRSTHHVTPGLMSSFALAKLSLVITSPGSTSANATATGIMRSEIIASRFIRSSSELVRQSDARLGAAAVQTSDTPALEHRTAGRVDEVALRQVQDQVVGDEVVEHPEDFHVVAVHGIDDVHHERNDLAAAIEGGRGQGSQQLPVTDTVDEHALPGDSRRQGTGRGELPAESLVLALTPGFRAGHRLPRKVATEDFRVVDEIMPEELAKDQEGGFAIQGANPRGTVEGQHTFPHVTLAHAKGITRQQLVWRGLGGVRKRDAELIDALHPQHALRVLLFRIVERKPGCVHVRC